MDDLERYRSKRDFGRTPEPSGRRRHRRWRGEPRFVIQKHAAGSLHYDLRLEADGVLKSWVVSKGSSTDPRVKRLAVEVEDYPLDYADFEGRIEVGYGAGAVIVWDASTYRRLTDGPVEKALAAGHQSVWLAGQKLRGGWILQRTSGSAGPPPLQLAADRLRRHADWVGIDIYPGTYVPGILHRSPVVGLGDAFLEGLTQMRKCYMPKASFTLATPLGIEETGYATGPGRSEAQQNRAARQIVGTAVAYRGT